MAGATLQVIIKGKDETKGLFSGFNQSLRTVGKAALGLVAGGLAAIGFAFRDATELARIQINAEKQLDQVLKSTSGAVGLTADQLKDLASELQSVTNFGDEAIIGGENLLLTFTNIGGDVFPRATETMLDMSQALGQDLKSSAVQLGKALNDPITGVTALQRVGVSFTEQQKDQIAAMVEAGDVMGAQTLILDELQKEFGGSARALADPAIQLKNVWGDFKEQIGSAILSVLNPLAQRALPALLNVMEALNPIINDAANFVRGFLSNIQSGMDPVNAIIDSFLTWTNIGENLSDKMFNLVIQISTFWDKLKEGAEPIMAAITNFVSLQDVLVAFGIAIAAVLVPAIISVVTTMAPIIITIGLVIGAVALLRNAWENNWGGIQEKVAAVWGWLQPVIQNLVNWLQVNIPIALDYLRMVWETVLLPAIQTVWAWMNDVLIPFITGVLVPWLQENIPAAIQVLTDFWENTLLPVLEAVWDFLTVRMMPIWEALADFFDAAFTVTLTALTGIWENVLLPALTAVWGFIKDKVVPIFETLWKFIKDNLGPVLQWLKSAVLDPASAAFATLSQTIQDVAAWIGRVADELRNIELPDWMTPGSPTPWEIGLRGVADAMKDLNRMQLPSLSSGLNGLPGPSFAGAGGGNFTTGGNQPQPVRVTLINPQFYGVSDTNSLLADLESLAT